MKGIMLKVPVCQRWCTKGSFERDEEKGKSERIK
jgi:hypothetical protein